MKNKGSVDASEQIVDFLLALVSGISFCIGLYMVIYYAPLLRHNGLPWWSQKIFYIHVPSAWGGMAGLIMVLTGAVAYLLTRKESWDAFAAAAAEPCLLFTTLVMITGPLWAKPSWNTYWKWEDPRLMSFFALWLVLVAYHLMRSFSEEGAGRRITSAALGIIGAVSVPLVFLSIKFGRTLHPKPVEMDAHVRNTLFVMLFSFTLLFILIMRVRYRLEKQHNRLLKLQQLVD